MKEAVKTERITILGSPDFKAFLSREAKKEGVSLSQLVRTMRKQTHESRRRVVGSTCERAQCSDSQG